jgi:hypothetical protein
MCLASKHAAGCLRRVSQAYAPDFERSVLTELLTTLRNIATGITAKLQA